MKITQEKYEKAELLINEFPKQLGEGAELAKDVGKKYHGHKFNRIVVAGMGGSALPGEILMCVARDINLKLPIIIHRNYNLPYAIQKQDLVVVISYSGNTEETLSAYREAKKQKLSLLAIATGGKLAEWARRDKTPLVIVPPGVPPRMALGYQFAALLGILYNVGLVKSQKNTLKEAMHQLNPAYLKKEGRKFAKKIGNRTVLFYASQRYRALAYILKIQMNENAEIHAFWNVFPELNHNEMVGYSRSANYHPARYITFLIKSADDHPRIKKRMEITEKMLRQKGYKTDAILMRGKNPFVKIFGTILLGDWVGYYHAKARRVDPLSIAIVEEFKKRMTAT